MPPKKGSKAATAAAAAAAAATPAAPAAADKKGGSKSSSSSSSSSGSAAGAAGAPGSTGGRSDTWFPKSKRAVKANGGIVTSRGDRTVGEWVVKEWQRLPKQLLQQWLQSQKRPKALYPSARCDVEGRVRVRIVLPDPKGKSEKDVTLVPKQDYASRQEAEEFAALLALHHVTPTLPLERKLPEPFASTWSSMGKPDALLAPAHHFASQAERQQHEDAQRAKANAREAKVENRERKYAVVNMSEENRTFIQDILRHLQQTNANSKVEAAPAGEGNGEAADPSSASSPSPSPSPSSSPAPASSSSSSSSSSDLSSSPLLTQLIQLGFERADALLALRSQGSTASLNDLLDFLMLHLPEHALPKQINPRGKQLEVVSHGNDQLSLFLGAGRMAIPRAVGEAAMQQAKGEVQQASGLLFSQFYSLLQPSDFTAPDCSDRTQSEVDDSIEEEVMALDAIFGSEFKRISTRHWSVKLSVANLNGVSLEVLVPPGCKYPMELPVLLVRCDQLSANQRLQLTGHMAKHVYENDLLSNPLTFDLHAWLMSDMDQLLRLPHLPLPAQWQSKQRVLSEEDKKNLTNITQKTAALTMANLAAVDSDTTASSSSSASSSTPSIATTADDTSSVSSRATRTTQATSSSSSSTGRSSRPRPPSNDVAASQRILEAWTAQKSTPAYLDMLKIRQTLPVYKQKQLIIDTCNKHQVVVLSGQTGSGKSTQLPQFLLDHMLESGAGSQAQVLVTQPRRISAVGLAERVAEERAEKCGQSVGYRIRGESKVSAATRLTFVTTGVLLRQLTSPRALSNLSHIVIDEVHERSVEIDFLLLILKQVLRDHPWIKLVLMSATLDAEVFANYFGGAEKCPVLNVEGRTFPVQDYFLEDILEEMEYVPDHQVRANVKAEELETRVEELRHKLKGNYSRTTLQSLATLNIHKLDFHLIESLIWHLIDFKPLGGILVFLPGVYEITKLCGMLERSSEQRTTKESYWILPLHGSLSSSNQYKVFATAPPHVRKIVVATNIAETSITVNDILYVIESGRVKQTEYDPESKMSALVETFVSQAAANQRKGRAGRVRSGTCLRLYSSVVCQEVMPSHQPPEIHRTALDHICLQIKLLRLDRGFKKEGLAKILSMCVQPPSPAAVQSAINTLKEAQALDGDEQLTPLGSHLARLPCDNTKIGKLLLFSAMFGCVTAMTRVAAILSGKPLFNAPSDAREEADRKKMSFAWGKSDALTQLKAMQQWCDILEKEGKRAAVHFAQNNFLSLNGLETAKQLSESYYKGLEEIGFVAPLRSSRSRSTDDDEWAEVRRHQDDMGEQTLVLSAVLTAAFYPNVLSVDAPAEQYSKGLHGAVLVEQDSKLFKFFQRGEDGTRSRVFLHPRSTLFKQQSYDSPWVTYLHKQHTDKTYVHECNIAYPYALMLFGKQLDTELEKGLIIVDGWIHFRAPARIAALIRALKQYLNIMLETKIQNPAVNIRQSPVITAILRILTTNGF